MRISAMTFTLSGFDSWTFQIVFYGSLLVLDPMDCTRQRAHALIRQPSCTLVGH